jgi:exopolysaccharide biosynthesis protein
MKKLFTYLFTISLIQILLVNSAIWANITDLTQETIMPGLIHHRFIKNLGRGPVIINILEIDTKQGFMVKPALAQPNTIWAKATLPEIVIREGAIAGINANYFTNRGMPIGSLAIDREWITGPYSHRASVSIDNEGKLHFARPTISGNLAVYKSELGNNNALSAYFPAGQKSASFNLKVDNINQSEKLNSDGISFFNHWWQEQVNCGNGRACLLVDGSGTVRTRVNSYDSSNPIQPTRTDYVLSASSDEKLGNIFQGDKLTLTWYSDPDWSNTVHVVGGGPYLVSRGEIVLNEKAEGFTARSGIGGVAPRTAVGMTAPGRFIWLVADGRQRDSKGLSLWELAALVKEIGVIEAINLDGGGSTTLVLNDQIINSPSDSGGARKVSTALVLYKRKSFGTGGL